MMKYELGIGVVPKANVVVALDETATVGAKAEPRKARRTQILSLSKGAAATSRKMKSGFVRFSVFFCAGLTLSVLIFMLAYIMVKGILYLQPSLFEWKYTSENCSVMPSLINTILMTVLALLIASPLGIGSAIYLVEYAAKENRFVKLVRLTTETLTGIPSIVYGLFGMLLFVGTFHWGYSLMAGSSTVAIMILPVIMRTTEEALFSVPDSFREGSFGLGAGKLRTVFKIVLPDAMPGILSGVILATGRVVGETAALMYTAGTVSQIPLGVFGSGRTLAVHMYILSSEGLHTNQAFATAVVLLLMVMIVNLLTEKLAVKIGK